MDTVQGIMSLGYTTSINRAPLDLVKDGQTVERKMNVTRQKIKFSITERQIAHMHAREYQLLWCLSNELCSSDQQVKLTCYIKLESYYGEYHTGDVNSQKHNNNRFLDLNLVAPRQGPRKNLVNIALNSASLASRRLAVPSKPSKLQPHPTLVPSTILWYSRLSDARGPKKHQHERKLNTRVTYFLANV
jgi:hypothetical protein